MALKVDSIEQTPFIWSMGSLWLGHTQTQQFKPIAASNDSFFPDSSRAARVRELEQRIEQKDGEQKM